MFRRRSIGKFIIFGLVISCFILYFRIINSTNNDSGTIDKDFLKSNHNKNIKNQKEHSWEKNELDNEIHNGHQKPHNIDEDDEVEIKKFNDRHYFEHQIQHDLDKQQKGLGDLGAESRLTDVDAKKRGQSRYKKIALNEELSETLSYNRTLSDYRNPKCADLKYNLNDLPTASVIIIFFNEPYSVLLRTVYSVINTSDKRILKEIILVDDSSTNNELKNKLDYFIETRFLADLVKVVRLKNRLGLIRARLAGARIAKGDVLVFLDAHCECNILWLEPMLQRIQESRTSVLVPIIDVIDAKTFQYSTNGYDSFQVGGFQWNGHFDWIDVPKRETDRKLRECNMPEEICSTFSPTMAGGLFAMSKDYFWEIGSYDEQMDGWGGENLEMSFRIWQCGGTIETIPCSRVGHVFRDFHPYSFPKNRDTHGINTIRMAKVWMDSYIKLFYLNRPDLVDLDVGDITHREILRKKLKCKSFDWYLSFIYPEKFIPTRNMMGYGRIHPKNRLLCLDDLQQNNEEPYNLGVYSCHEAAVAKSQFFSLTRDGVLRNELSCATVQKSFLRPFYVVMAQCNMNPLLNDKWTYTPKGHLIHIKTGMCLDSDGLDIKDFALAATCVETSDSQKWVIEH